MTTAMTTIQVPAHIAARIAARQGQPKSAIIAAVASGGDIGPQISTRGGRFRLKEDGVETIVGITMDVVIVGANPKISKIWYSKQYNAADPNVRPDCASDDGITPNADIASPFHANCQTCPNNVLGSKKTPNGANSKICGDQRHLAVVPAADPTKVYGLSVPISGMKALREYFKDLDNYGLIPEDVITQLGFDDQAEYPKLTFKQKPENGFVPEAAIPAIAKIMASDEVKRATRTIPQPTRAALPAPAEAPAIPPPAYTPPPVNVAPPVQAPAATVPTQPTNVVSIQPAAAPPAAAQAAAAPPAAAQAAAAPAEPPAPVSTTPSAPLGELEDRLAKLFG